MAPEALRRKSRWGIWPVIALFGILLVSLSLMSDATHHSDRFGQLYSWLLLVNAIGLVILLALIGTNLYWMVSQYRARAPGALLTARLVVTFVVLAVVPISIVYYFSLQFLQRGIDSWFNVQIESALNDALDLSRGALDVRLADLLDLTKKIADELDQTTAAVMPIALYDLRVRSSAIELTVFSSDGRIIASSSQDSGHILPTRPTKEVQLSLSQGRPYVALDPLGDRGLYVRAVVPVLTNLPGVEQYVLQALYEVPGRISGLADNVQLQVARYRELSFLRRPLKYSYILTLSLVLVLSLLSAVWAAFFSARRLVAPIGVLADGTRAVADGDYSKRLPVDTEDELGFLVRSFNEMTRRLAQARDEARRSQFEVEGQRARLETVLGSLSSGVLSIRADGALSTANGAATEILGLDVVGFVGKPLSDLVSANPFLEPLIQAIVEHKSHGLDQWTTQVVFSGNRGRRVLMCRGAQLPVGDADGSRGQVVVFDDVTDLIKAQRDAAWGEIARRLAHEIKNPLTPIQLSAERLRRKYLNMMSQEEADVLDRATHTIVQQVESLKEMVNAFSDYARAPTLDLQPLLLHDLLQEVLDLYKSGDNTITTRLAQPAPLVQADAGRLRQLLHNLIKNALESVQNVEDARLLVETRWVTGEGGRYIELCFEDNGAGFAQDVLDRLFEPYVTTKARGTGLGLAIVRKIVEEHNADIRAFNTEAGHARIEIRLAGEPADPLKRAGRAL